MIYALFDTAQNTIVKRFGGSLPGRLDWGDGSQVSPVSVGMANGDLMVVTVIDTDTAPDRWSTESGAPQYSLTGTEVTVTRSFAKTSAPTASMVAAEAERRITARYSTVKQMKAIAQWIHLKQIVDDGGNLTQGQAARLQAIKDAFAWMISVDDTADTIAALSPIPDDYADDARWPA